MSHLEQSVRRKAGAERTGHWFRAISESEPDETYLKTAAADLSRTCEATECQHSDSDETLFIHNLQSVADYVRAAQVSIICVPVWSVLYMYVKVYGKLACCIEQEYMRLDV